MKKKVLLTLALTMAFAAGLTGCGKSSTGTNGEVVVYNWGEYIDPDTLNQFEEETGIHVVYDEFETNEIMYPKVESGTSNYDVVCPSDYMIQKMIENDLLAEINFDNIPNVKNIGEQYFEQSKGFDPENKYSIPYFWGTVGILYNKSMIHEEITSWDSLFNGEYAGEIIMQNSIRDAYMCALKYQGHSLNTTNRKELQQAQNLLLKQKPDVEAYFVDEVREEMVAGNAALAVCYSGEAYLAHEYENDLEYVLPEEGSNIWIDSWIMMKKGKNHEGAQKFLDYLCRGDVAVKNFEEIYYPTPNTAG